MYTEFYGVNKLKLQNYMGFWNVCTENLASQKKTTKLHGFFKRVYWNLRGQQTKTTELHEILERMS